MTTNEFYYLLLVLGSFGAFAVGLLMASFRHQAWQRHAKAAGRPRTH